MPEKSYPFSDDSAGGGGKLVSQTQWQAMSHLWAIDCIDFSMVNSTYTAADMPLNVTLSGSNVVVSPGSAWVGGFYYKLDTTLTIPAPTNTGSNPRTDLVVLRANLATGSVNIAIVTGQAAASPTEPAVTKTLGGIWEMPLMAITLAANNGTKTLGSRRAFRTPGTVQVPFSRPAVSLSLTPGTFTLDMDSNTSGGLEEGFRSYTGDMITRSLGPRQPYTPDLFTVTNKPVEANRIGYWRYIAPGTVQFSVNIINTSSTAVTSTSGWFMGITLPVTPSLYCPTVVQGVLTNNEARDGLPNLVNIVGQTSGTSGLALYYPNPTYLAEGLDGLTKIPGKSTLNISGVYETNYFEDRSLSG